MSNDRSEEPEEDLVQLVREPLSPMASFHPFQLESSRDTAVTKSKGTPIDVPKAAPRLSTFSSPNTTLRTGLPSSSGSRRKSSVSLQGGRASPPFGSKEGFDVVGQIPQLSRTQNERSKVKREHFNFLSDDEDQKDSKIPKRRNTGYQSTSLPMKATGTSPSSPLAGSSAYYVSRMRKHASPAESACATQSTSSVSSTSLAASSVTLKRGTSSSTLAALNRLKRPIIESNRIRYSSDLSTSSRQKPSSLMHASSSERASVSDSVRPPVHRRPFLFEHTSLPDKVSALGMGTFPQASLSCVLLGDMHEFRNSGMAIQFGPDRFILNIDKNVTKIPHDNIRRIEHEVNGDVKILVVQTKTSLQAPSVLEPYYDPTPNSGKAKKIILLSNADSDAITNCCKKLKRLNCDVRPLSPEATEKILLMSNKHTETKDASGSKGSEGSMLSAHSTDAGNAKQNTTTRRGDDTLFQFPFKGSARSKSIAVRVEDMSRLKEGEFLNDTLIEFGLKHVHANLESRDSELAENTYIFNSFFYERLVSSSGKGIAYDAVKSWTNKIDLFSKKFIIIPIHENMHWFLAIISNPGLLLSDVSTTSSQSMTSDLNIEPERKSPSPPSTGSAESIGDVSHSNSTPGSSSQTNQEDIQRDGETKSTRRSLRPSTVSAASVDAEAKPYILVLDSLGGPHAGVFKSLRAYLQQELQARKGIQRTIDSKDVPGKLAKCPQQENFCDCGLFVLHYAEAFLNHPGPLLDEIVNKKDESSEYWTADGLALKREKYREIMTSLAEEYKTFLQEQIKIKKANPGV